MPASVRLRRFGETLHNDLGGGMLLHEWQRSPSSRSRKCQKSCRRLELECGRYLLSCAVCEFVFTVLNSVVRRLGLYLHTEFADVSSSMRRYFDDRDKFYAPF
ncbi:hypothetical protein HPB50_025957 [Hyalomma asiaticum]|uniref:Uncharacterized protein n=1 Tax=Hyalomma asiaticum TaxID=266040 RepID=A0ACB7T5F6_HYAAI|nr:hypothetical protein HPB50_025957 [Hyalomma asiaticum]